MSNEKWKYSPEINILHLVRQILVEGLGEENWHSFHFADEKKPRIQKCFFYLLSCSYFVTNIHIRAFPETCYSIKMLKPLINPTYIKIS